MADTKNAQSKKKTGSSKGKPWTFPKNTLEDAIKVAKVIEDRNAGKPTKAVDTARELGFNRASDWRFLELLRSANQYGLVSGSGANATIRLESIGEDIVAPGTSSQRQEALLRAVQAVQEFKAVDDFYRDKRLPEDEFFENTLVRDFDVPRDRVKAFTEVFRKNLAYLKLFAGSPAEPSPLADDSAKEAKSLPANAVRRTKSPKHVREFLDSCFVMMPFGQWFDRYYQEIYSPAIKEAGFEPLRADELFSTGTVVEQIWEQVEKAPVLLADLTGKNANVFYELGLAHAARKPVVLTAETIDDVPFDLRHLRIIIYNIREPNWAPKLAGEVTDFLKNAKADPAKSIPQPFRDHLPDHAG